jgi:hypothetical protein
MTYVRAALGLQGIFAACASYRSGTPDSRVRSANAWFLRGFITWKRGDAGHASTDLSAARNVRGPDWKPFGSVLEGDVQHRMYSESGFLNVFEQQWDGSQDLVRAYAPLDAYLRRLR